MRRLQEMERAVIEGAEEQEERIAPILPPTAEPPLNDVTPRPDAEGRYQKMRQRSQPLGLIERTY